ncbi:CdaR family protein [Thermaerobacillus caldiproteolyticus]|uniref:CdaR family protein n=1 Tax=Thermaerobacillus caldiproteolyticus TaxID=247480 RepID=UPI00188A09DC|nr:CdaR family protein [Anoxybacillus caldiproteolyticus]QPA31103.1 YbbR-like domain-containing protein [Anoxybacillus caldiproteolyticus]
MDKLMNNHWFMKIFSLLLAIMLYMSVNIEEKETKSGAITRNSVGQTDIETITNVPVVTYYDEENLVVSGIPKTVNVTLEGPASILKPTALQRDFEIYVDLTNLELGTHTVPIKYKNISDKLNVKIQPATATVTIHEKVSKDFPVDVDFIHQNKVATGYSVEQPIVKPNMVTITGAKELVDRVALVKARVNLEGAKETIEQESKVTVYDNEGRVLNLEVDPSVVEVTVPVTSPSKSVPLKINRIGILKKGLSIVKIETVPNQVTIFGPKEKIDRIEFIDGITINLGEITKDTTLEMKVPLPEGVKSVDPSKVKINIQVQEEQTKTFKALPIHVLGLSDQYTVEFLEPEEQNMDVQLSGAPSILNSIQADDLELYINVNELGVGEHEVPVEVNGPQNITWNLPKNKVKIKISQKIINE